MRICHVITGLNQGGAEHALFRLLSLEPAPAEVQIVSLTGEGIFRERLEAMGFKVVCLGLRPDIPSPLKFLRLVRLLKQWKPEVVQTWMYHADLFGGLAAALAGVPVCWGIRNFDLIRSKPSTRFVMRLCAGLSRFVPARAISCSARAAELHRSFGYAVPFEVIANGLDVGVWAPRRDLRTSVRAELGVDSAAYVFAHAGRSDPVKDHRGLALAFNRVHALTPDARLILCGSGLSSDERYFQKLPFTDSARAAVLPLGPRDDLPRIWQAADAFVLSSSAEAFPNVVLEAMACGLPCVVTDVGDAAEIVGTTGLVVRPSDPDGLAAAMLELCGLSETEHQRIGAAARLRVVERFSLERMASSFRRVWSDVSKRGAERCAA